MTRPAETKRAMCTDRKFHGSVMQDAHVSRVLQLGTLVSAVVLCKENACHAASAMPADAPVGLFYAITHLHPLAYFILSLIVVLSVVNLVIQGWISREKWPLNRIFHASGDLGGGIFGFWRSKPPRKPKIDTSVSVIQGGPDYMGGVIGVPRPVKVPQDGVQAYPPTPLDGLNHPIPKLAASVSAQNGSAADC